MTQTFLRTLAALFLLITLSFGQVSAKDMMHSGSSDTDGMSMHHMHMMLNHAMEMVAEGANLAMLGQMNMAKGIDDLSVRHGNKMISDAKSIVHAVMNSEAMLEMHKHGTAPGHSAEMDYTHQLSAAVLSYIRLIEGMPK